MARLGPQFDPQKLSQSLRTEGGFSVDPETGQSPASGVVASKHGKEYVVPGVAGPGEIESHAKEVQSGAYLGGWLDDGTTFLDESRVFPDQGKAEEFGRRNAQRAVYNIDTDDDPQVPFTEPVRTRDTLLEGLPDEKIDEMNRADNEHLRKQVESRLDQQATVRRSPGAIDTLRRRGAEHREQKRDKQVPLF